jgi:molybdopterin/thiamine biosynthesis adenylyltransferase/rhodanese-related sulfurtransferase
LSLLIGGILLAELRDMKALVERGRALSDAEKERYSRHLLIPNLDFEGQERIVNSKVLCVGAGGLGSPTIMYLAAAGIGEIGIVDFDRVEITNLQRQIIHTQNDLGKSKALSAKEKVTALNPEIKVITYEVRLDSNNAIEIFRNYDLIIDCTDNFATRYLINDAAALLGKPYIWGSIYQFDGQASVFWSQYGPCYRCMHPTPPPFGSVPSCAEGGVLGVLCGAIGSIQSNEAIKLITGIGQSLLGNLLIYDALESSFEKIEIKRNPACPICNGEQKVLLEDYEEFCGLKDVITPSELRKKTHSYFLVDVREPEENKQLAIPGSILIPKGEFEDGSAFAKLPLDREIILHCRSGVRSAKCLELIRAAGFSNSKHLKGGIIAWEESKS